MGKKKLRTVLVLLGSMLIPAMGWAEEVTFRVTVPGNTPAGESVYVVGNLAGLGEWDPGALEMTSVESGIWEIVLDLPDGASIEYKYTRGGWSSVEKTSDGAESDNRTVRIAAGMIIEDEVPRWADVTPGPKAKPVTSATGKMVVLFRVVVPPKTPEGEPVYISGDLPEFGVWDGGRVEFTQVEPGVWEAEVEFSAAGWAEYKYTRGGWGTVEKKADGGEADNRRIMVEPGALIEDVVIAWADVPAEGGAEVTLLSNTDLSSSMMVNGRYVSTYISEREPDDRYRLNRPSHDIRLDFLATVGPTVSVWARASFFTGEQFHFSFDFDRAWAHVHPEEFDLKAFYNEEIVAFDDPFNLVGHRDLWSTIGNDNIPFGRGSSGAEIRFGFLGMDLDGMVANIHDFDVRNDPDAFDEVGTDWMAGRVTRDLGHFWLGLTGRRIRTANWASVYETTPPPPQWEMDVGDYSNEFFELNETDDVFALDLSTTALRGALDLVLGGGYQKWQAGWVIGSARERVYLGEHVKVDDKIGSTSGFLGLVGATFHLSPNLTLGYRFHRESLDALGEGDSYVAWVLKHRDDANQHIFPIGLPGHNREVDHQEWTFGWSGSAVELNLLISKHDDNRRAFLVSSDRHATQTRVLPEIAFRFGDRLETIFRYVYERGTRFGLSESMGISYAEQEWETGYRFRFASETEKVDTRIFAVSTRYKLRRNWYWDLDYQRWNLWRDYGNNGSVEVDGIYGMLFTGFTYEPRKGIQIQLALGVDPVDDEDDRLAGREMFMRRRLGDWQYSDGDGDGIRNYQDRVNWSDDTPGLVRSPTIGELMQELSDTKQVMIKARIQF